MIIARRAAAGLVPHRAAHELLRQSDLSTDTTTIEGSPHELEKRRQRSVPEAQNQSPHDADSIDQKCSAARQNTTRRKSLQALSQAADWACEKRNFSHPCLA